MIMEQQRTAIIAGNGLLPVILARRLAENGHSPIIIGVEGEADAALGCYDLTVLPLEKIAYSLPLLKTKGAAQIVFAGGVRRRPRPLALRVPVSVWRDVPAALLALKRGDDGLLAAMVAMFERHGFTVVGAHQILPDHVAAYGVISGVKPKTSMHAAIDTGVRAAKAVGAMDIGQAVIAVSRRVIAVEGLEGTDQMLARVAALRASGRLEARAKPVLIKLAKPGQELRADMPVIGAATLEACRVAGISLIVISAGSTLILDVEQTLDAAQSAGISIMGINPDEWQGDAP